MIRHFFTLTWNKRKRNILLIIEIFFVYLIISFLVYFKSYDASEGPEHFNISNVLEMKADSGMTDLRRNIKTMKEVQDVTVTSYLPYRNRQDNMGILKYSDRSAETGIWYADESLYNVLSLSIASGRWFQLDDASNISNPVIINMALKNQVFGDQNAVNRIVKIDSTEHTIIGVIEDLNDPSMGHRGESMRNFVFKMGEGGDASVAVRLKQPLNANTYKKLTSYQSQYRNEFAKSIIPQNQTKELWDSQELIPAVIFLGLGGFLIVNVILGLYSILFQNINRRRSEIGLRRVSGATAWQLYTQIIWEVVLLATIAMVPGIIVAYQFALFRTFGDELPVYYYSIVVAIVFVYALVILCAIYPARLAAAIQPAEALHEE